VQYSKEEYEKKKKELDFGSYKILSKSENLYNKFALNLPNRYASIIKSTGATGDMIMNSKNVKRCFDLYGNIEDSKYLIHFVDAKDCYDIYGGGAVISLSYEGVDVGIEASRQLFAVLTHSCLETYYTYMCFSSKNLFGCIGLCGKQYCILNKQYTKEEIIKNGYTYRVPPEKDYQTTIKSEDLPDHIKDVSDFILEEIIACPNNGQESTQCTKAFRIIKPELEFLKNNNIALPRYCPNCRHYQRLKQRNPFHLWHRQCQCAGINSENKKYKNTIEHTHGDESCPNEFETPYAPDRPEIIYCEKCYQQEVY